MNHHLFKNKNTHVGWQKSRLESTKERMDDDKLKKVFLDNFIKNFLLGIWEEVDSMALIGKRSIREKAFSKHKFSSRCEQTCRFSICFLMLEITEPEKSDKKSDVDIIS